MPKISIILPVYNAEAYLCQSLNSILAQTIKDFEVIAINDGSTDSSLTILNEYAQRDSRIHIINQENGGVAKARNVGMECAKGEYIAFMDPDDWYISDKTLNNLYDSAIRNNALICGGSLNVFEHGVVRPGVGKEMFTDEKFVNYSEYQYDYGYQRFIYQRDFLQRNNIFFPNYKRFQDPPFFVKAMCLAKKFYTLPEATYCYRLGHQDKNWPEQKTVDAIRGLTDNLVISAQYGLEKLHLTTAFRFKESGHLTPIVNQLTSGSQKVLHALIIANSKVNVALLNKNKKSFDDNLLLEPLKVLLDSLSFSNAEQKKLLDKLMGIENTASYKIGRFITWIPRKISGGIACIKIHGLTYTLKLGIKKVKSKLFKR